MKETEFVSNLQPGTLTDFSMESKQTQFVFELKKHENYLEKIEKKIQVLQKDAESLTKSMTAVTTLKNKDFLLNLQVKMDEMISKNALVKSDGYEFIMNQIISRVEKIEKVKTKQIKITQLQKPTDEIKINFTDNTPPRFRNIGNVVQNQNNTNINLTILPPNLNPNSEDYKSVFIPENGTQTTTNKQNSKSNKKPITKDKFNLTHIPPNPEGYK